MRVWVAALYRSLFPSLVTSLPFPFFLTELTFFISFKKPSIVSFSSSNLQLDSTTLWPFASPLSLSLPHSYPPFFSFSLPPSRLDLLTFFIPFHRAAGKTGGIHRVPDASALRNHIVLIQGKYALHCVRVSTLCVMCCTCFPP